MNYQKAVFHALEDWGWEVREKEASYHIGSRTYESCPAWILHSLWAPQGMEITLLVHSDRIERPYWYQSWRRALRFDQKFEEKLPEFLESLHQLRNEVDPFELQKVTILGVALGQTVQEVEARHGPPDLETQQYDTHFDHRIQVGFESERLVRFYSDLTVVYYQDQRSGNLLVSEVAGPTLERDGVTYLKVGEAYDPEDRLFNCLDSSYPPGYPTGYLNQDGWREFDWDGSAVRVGEDRRYKDFHLVSKNYLRARYE